LHERLPPWYRPADSVRINFLTPKWILKMKTRGPHFISSFALVFMSVAGLSGLAGCSHSPEIYTMPTEQLEKIRSETGTVGLSYSSYSSELKIVTPAKGAAGGAKKGFVLGAATPVVAGFVSPLPGGTLMGALVAPFAAIGGSVYGALKAPRAEEVQKAEDAIDQAVIKLEKLSLRRPFIDEVIRLGVERAGRRFVDLPAMGPRDPDEIVRYDPKEIPNVDTILELRAGTAGLKGLYTFDPPTVAFIEVHLRLVRVYDNREVFSETFVCASEEERTYADWAKNEGQLLVDEFVSCMPALAEKIVDDLFLVYPISPR
jgi:hypothetical protein